jgi:RNA polymerase sigma-70 factor (ECF subfamily)
MMDNPEQPVEEVLMREVAQGSELAFTWLYRRHQLAIYRYARHMCGSTSVAADVTQETFITLLDKAADFRAGEASVYAYLCGIARNVVMRHLRKNAINASREISTEDLDRAAVAKLDQHGAGDPLDQILSRERVDWLKEALARIAVIHREVIVLCELSEMSYEQAASVMGIPVGTVRSRLSRAKSALFHEFKRVSQLNANEAQGEKA